MFVSSLRLVNFRSYCDATVRFGAGLNVVVGENATGKTNLLEGAWFALRGSSPRTRREEKLITWGERFARVELELDGPRRQARSGVEVGYAPGQGKRVRWDGRRGRLAGRPARAQPGVHLRAREPAAGQGQPGAAARPSGRLRRRARPAVRRRRARPAGGAAAAQRPTARRSSTAPIRRHAGPMGRAVRARRRRSWGAAAATSSPSSAGRFAAAAAGAGAGRASASPLRLVSQLEAVGYDEAALLEELRARRPGEVGRGLSLFGPHRDDLKFLEVGRRGGRRPPAGARPTRPRTPAPTAPIAAVPAAPSAARSSCRAAAATCGSSARRASSAPPSWRCSSRSSGSRRRAPAQQGPLFLDDVMSELDDARRRLLVRSWRRPARPSSRRPTATTSRRRSWREATVVELPLDGSLAAGAAAPPADDRRAGAAARLDAL